MQIFGFLTEGIKKLRRGLRGLFQFSRADCVVEIRCQHPGLILPWAASLVWYAHTLEPVPAACFMALSSLFGLSYLWARRMGRSVTASRRLKYSVFQVGDWLEEEITLKNSGLLPVIWALFSDRSSIPGYLFRSVRAVSGQETVPFTASTLCETRGIFALGPWQVEMGTPFGLFTCCQIFPDKQEIIVYPPLSPLPEHALPHHSVKGEHRSLRQPLSAETINASAPRAYVLGDSLRRIHWPTSARQGKLYVKTFDPESSSRVWLIPDLEADHHFGTGAQATIESAAVLAASLADILLAQGLAVGMFAEGEPPLVVQPQRGTAHLWELLKAAAVLQPLPGRTLGAALEHSRALIPARDLLLVISPSADPSWARRLRSLSASAAVFSILLDPQSYGGRGDARLYTEALAGLNISAAVLKREELHPVLGTYGAVRRWEFKVLGTGRVVVQQSPRPAQPESGAWKGGGAR